MDSSSNNDCLKIGDVSRMVGLSATVIRMWERLGLTHPRRSPSKYRLYSSEDLKLLKRASFLRKVRGMNPSAIVQTLKREGVVQPSHTPNGALGSRLRQLRLNKGVSLASVAKAVGMSVGFLSALERGQMSASVGTLRRLARHYKQNIVDFYDTAGTPTRVVHPDARKVLDAGPGVRMELLAWGHKVMEPHLFRIAPGASSGESYSHVGEEFLFVLKGEFEILLRGEKHRLQSGDSFYFESAVPHEWTNPGRTETLVLWVNTPPTF